MHPRAQEIPICRGSWCKIFYPPPHIFWDSLRPFLLSTVSNFLHFAWNFLPQTNFIHTWACKTAGFWIWVDYITAFIYSSLLRTIIQHILTFQMKGKVSDFKENLPLIQCICNKGMRDRHWDEMSKIVEFSIKPDNVSFDSRLLSSIHALQNTTLKLFSWWFFFWTIVCC